MLHDISIGVLPHYYHPQFYLLFYHPPTDSQTASSPLSLKRALSVMYRFRQTDSLQWDCQKWGMCLPPNMLLHPLEGPRLPRLTHRRPCGLPWWHSNSHLPAWIAAVAFHWHNWYKTAQNCWNQTFQTYGEKKRKGYKLNSPFSVNIFNTIREVQS